MQLDMQSTKSQAEARAIQDSREVARSCSFSDPPLPCLVFPHPAISFSRPALTLPRDCRDQREKGDRRIKCHQQKSRFRDYKTPKDETNPILKANPYTVPACSGSAHVSREGGSQPGGEKG